MRLAEKTQAIISHTAHEVFGPDVAVKIFGSKLDSQAKGGDIDLLIEADQHVPNPRHKSLELVAKLQMRLGDQAIDVIIVDPQTKKQPIHLEAIRTAVAI